MYERFTDTTRQLMQRANREALFFNHEYIGTEHILLGLLDIGCSVATKLLKSPDIREVRRQVGRIVQSPGSECVVMGKLPHTPRAKKVIEYSVEEARNLNHNYISTEHLLLGLLREGQSVAAQVLINLGLNLDEVRKEFLDWRARQLIEPSWLSWNDGTVLRMARAVDEGQRWHDLPILADALEEAGCTDEEILTHLRQPDKHVCGCWVIDRLLAGA